MKNKRTIKDMELNFSNSIVEQIEFRSNKYFLKRDDLIHSEFSGNKARKFYSYFQQDLSSFDTIVSYGGNQSNAMYSLAALAKLKGVKYKYYTRPIPKFLLKKPIGNFEFALENGMQVFEISDFNNIKVLEGELLIKQGGAELYAEAGVKLLADEINEFAQENSLEQLSVFLPSGTGSTAVFLQKNCNFPVYTVPCVGDEVYLRKQFSELVDDEKLHPRILPIKKKYAFGKLYKEFINIWKEVTNETQKPFDLLYDPLGWLIVDEFCNVLGDNVLYIQCGGISGNETMFNRYRRKNWA